MGDWTWETKISGVEGSGNLNTQDFWLRVQFTTNPNTGFDVAGGMCFAKQGKGNVMRLVYAWMHNDTVRVYADDGAAPPWVRVIDVQD